MMRLSQVVAVTIAALANPISAHAYSGNLLYCGEAGDVEIYVDFDLFDASIARYYTVVPGGYGGAPVITELSAVPGMPNPVYAADNVSLSVETDRITLNDTLESFTCQLEERAKHMTPPQAVALAEGDWNEIDVNRPGKSWAGVLRAGPGMEFERVTSLKLDQKVTLLTRTDITMNNYDWYRIELESGVVGYKWGGILCDPSGTETGTFNEDDCIQP